MTLAAENVSLHRGGRAVLEAVSIRIEPGRLQVLIGPNGAGKSTLLALLAGEQPPQSGRVTLDQRPLADWPRKALARRRAVMRQQESLSFPFTAAEVVALGRLPWPGSGLGPDAADDPAVQAAMSRAGCAALADRPYPELSGGERARVQFARALAQLATPEPAARYLLLDEPTAHLDFAFQHHCLATLRELAAAGHGVLAIVQDPNLALAYADDVSLLAAGRMVAQGSPAAVLTPQRLSALYGLPMERASIGTRTVLLPGRARDD